MSSIIMYLIILTLPNGRGGVKSYLSQCIQQSFKIVVHNTPNNTPKRYIWRAKRVCVYGSLLIKSSTYNIVVICSVLCACVLCIFA